MATASSKIRRAKPLLGTFVEIEAAGPDRSALNRATDAAFEVVAAVHRLMSFHDSESDISRLNREAFDRPIRVQAWTFRVIETCVELHRRSNGVFDVSVAPVLQSMGLLPKRDEDALIDARTPDAIELVEGQMVRFRHRHARIDLGGIAKGFAVDRALDALRGAGTVACGLVNAGGDLAAFGAEMHPIHIRHPRDPQCQIGHVKIGNEPLASSARRFDPFHAADTKSPAIICPDSRASTSAIDGVTVRAASCMIADALTKIVMISGTRAAGLLELYSASALLIAADGSVHISPDWQHAVHLAA
jgi:thiamine biosynthesis lipoprotein